MPQDKREHEKKEETTARIRETELQNMQPRFGICFDVDGVLARGTQAIPAAVNAMKELVDERGEMQVPVAYVTNALNRNQDKANQIARILGIKVRADQVVHSASPLALCHQLHDKHCLIIGQGDLHSIATELGFRKMCFLEDVNRPYPLLDMVDHENRKRKNGYVITPLPRIEAMVLLGEPKRWESALQLLVDVLQTDGQPDEQPDGQSDASPAGSSPPYPHIPVVACNMDLCFMERASMPRYGHGAFLLCFEALYKKISGHDLQYSLLVGKPSEVTFRYAEHVLHKQAERLGVLQPLRTMYMIGDSVESDIAGANLYQKYIDRSQRQRNNTSSDADRADHHHHSYQTLPTCRQVPAGLDLTPQTVHDVYSILVCTGCYRPSGKTSEDSAATYRPHRDFPLDTALYKPQRTLEDVHRAVEYIMEREKFCCR